MLGLCFKGEGVTSPFPGGQGRCPSPVWWGEALLHYLGHLALPFLQQVQLIDLIGLVGL